MGSPIVLGNPQSRQQLSLNQNGYVCDDPTPGIHSLPPNRSHPHSLFVMCYDDDDDDGDDDMCFPQEYEIRSTGYTPLVQSVLKLLASHNSVPHESAHISLS